MREILQFFELFCLVKNRLSSQCRCRPVDAVESQLLLLLLLLFIRFEINVPFIN